MSHNFTIFTIKNRLDLYSLILLFLSNVYTRVVKRHAAGAPRRAARRSGAARDLKILGAAKIPFQCSHLVIIENNHKNTSKFEDNSVFGQIFLLLRLYDNQISQFETL